MKQEAKQAEIINAAQELFTAYGFEKTTMTDIARRLGISKAALYYYFSDKESIIKSLAIREQEQFIAEIQTITTEATSTLEKLLAYATKRIELLQRHLTLSSMNLGTYASIKSLFVSILKEFRKQESELVTEIISIGIDKQEIQTELAAAEYAELYLDVLMGLRKNAFYSSERIEMNNLQFEAIKQVKHQSQLFTEIFIKGISD
ncbi:TetR/AcrR family transcriptional regulator [Saccharicrinis sp. FJH54]|uniref:TetR/AcrR family transcriptional regulator n=1 Tax=Saccharicrinis sp. FJH54 TaxID=3344665 RepID=UPI0035D4377D